MKHVKRHFASRPATAACSALLLAAVASTPALAGDDSMRGQSWEGAAHDAWVDGKIEASFTINRYLNPFTIDTRVDDGVVILSGKVESQIDKDLAGQIARGTEGVKEVRNELEVVPGSRDAGKDSRDFGDYVADATLTARVKYALIANDTTKGLSIDVDTAKGRVTLKGDVDSDEEKQLAGRIAQNVSGVEAVDNQLKVQS
ncbi:MAG: BON domain-containing protein [Lysobacterales bacterium]|jgi:osmotically-inducible protein OsmY